MAGAAHRTATSKDFAGYAGLEFRAPLRNRACSASPTRCVCWKFYARCSASSRAERDSGSSARLWRHRQPGRQVDGCDSSCRGNDALRLLDTTRAYALEISIDDTEAVELATRHATYYRQWLEQTGVEWPTLSSGVQRAPYFVGINNVRAALEWCFGVNGNAEIGVALAAAAAPVFLAIGLLSECQRWSERAILALDDATRGGNEEMHLQAALGLSSMFGRGGSESVRVAFKRSHAIAEERGDVRTQVQALSMLCMLQGTRFGDFQTALEHAKRCSTVSK